MTGELAFQRHLDSGFPFVTTELYDLILSYMPKDYQIVDTNYQTFSMYEEMKVYIYSKEFVRDGQIVLRWNRCVKPIGHAADGGIDQYNRLDYLDFREVSDYLGVIKIGYGKYGIESIPDYPVKQSSRRSADK